MTLTEMITAVKTNLGNRSSGQIGDQSVDTVVIQAINRAFMECNKLANPSANERVMTVTLATGSREFPLPTVDSNGVTGLTVKQIRVINCAYSAGKTPVCLQLVPHAYFVEATPDWDQELEGIPHLLTLFGNQLKINLIPQEDLLLTLYVEVYPKTLTTSDLNVALPIEDIWLYAIESCATHTCYLKLQQLQLADYYRSLYEREKEKNSRQINATLGNTPNQMFHGSAGGQPWLNPFVTRWGT